MANIKSEIDIIETKEQQVNLVEKVEQVVVQESGARGLKGSQIIKGYGNPSNSTGTTGDYFFDTATYRIYGPKPTDTSWDLTAFVTLQGIDGKSFLSGVGTPSSSLGKFEDTYLDIATGTLYKKDLTGWVQGDNIVPLTQVSYQYEQQFASKGGKVPLDGGTGDGGWYIYHNLGYKPAVSVMDYSKNNIECDIEHMNDDLVVLRFNDYTTGYAYLS